MNELQGETWKTINFNFEISNKSKTEISNYGRLRTFNNLSSGNIIKGSMINGYRIIRLRLYKPRHEKDEGRLQFLQDQVFKLTRELKSMKQNKESETVIRETTELLTTLKKNLSKKFRDDLKKRTINYHSLIHRLVAEYFLPAPLEGQTIVAHIDHEKLNNVWTNLKWMTPEENYDHQKRSPYVIKDKEERREKNKYHSRATKLSVTKVMLLKKLINEGKPMKQLVRQFKVSDTQILRIHRGENWGDIEAAK